MPNSVLKQTLSGTGYVGSMFDGINNDKVENASAPETAEDYFQSLTSLTAVTIPSNTQFVRISGPSGNTNNLRIAGAVGASVAESVILDPMRPSLLALPSASPRLCIGAAGSTNNVRTEFF